MSDLSMRFGCQGPASPNLSSFEIKDSESIAPSASTTRVSISEILLTAYQGNTLRCRKWQDRLRTKLPKNGSEIVTQKATGDPGIMLPFWDLFPAERRESSER